MLEISSEKEEYAEAVGDRMRVGGCGGDSGQPRVLSTGHTSETQALLLPLVALGSCQPPIPRKRLPPGTRCPWLKCKRNVELRRGRGKKDSRNALTTKEPER